MKIKDILKVKGTKVWMVGASQSIQDALELLMNHRIGSLLVVDERSHNVVGILSERDIVQHLAKNHGKLEEIPVRDWMTRKLITVTPEDAIEEVMSIMTEKRIRHIPVMVEGELAGMVSIGDVVKALLEHSEHEIRHLKEYMYGPSL